MRIKRDGKVIYDTESGGVFPENSFFRDGDVIEKDDWEVCTSEPSVYTVVSTGDAYKKGTQLSGVSPGVSFEPQD